MRFAFPIGACALLLAALPAVGQETTARDVRNTSVRPSSNLLGTAVTLDGRRLGRVSDTIPNEAGDTRDLIIRTADGLVIVPYADVRYDLRTRDLVIRTGVTPRRYTVVRSLADEPPPSDRFQRGARLSRVETTEPSRIERVIPPSPAPMTWGRDSVSRGLRDLARAASVYSEPFMSVSLTRNIDRLPRRSPRYDSYTLWGEATGRRIYDRKLNPPPPPLP